MADGTQTQQAGPRSRARRLKDEEWDPFRSKIERLYFEEDYTRDGVIEELKQVGFPVTLKQLKHILQKWGITKTDKGKATQTTLAVKRKHEEIGKSATFVYKGHVMDEEKVRRAEKRHKISTSSDAVLPSHIQVLSPKTSHRSPSLARSIAQGFELSNILSNIDLLNAFRDGQFDTSNVFAPGQVDITLPSDNADSGPASTQNDAGRFSSIHNIISDPFSTGESLRLRSPDSFTSMMNWDFDMPPSADGSGTPRLCDRLPTPVLNSAIASPTTMPVDFHFPVLPAGRQTLLRSDQDSASLPNSVTFYGDDPRTIIAAIETMTTLFERLQDGKFFNRRMRFHGMSEDLRREIKSEFLLDRMDDVAKWVYEASAKSVQQHRTARQSSRTDVRQPLQRNDTSSEPMSRMSNQGLSNKETSARLEGKLVSYFNVARKGVNEGSIQIQLRRANEISEVGEEESLTIMAIPAIPGSGNRAAPGIFVAMPTSTRFSRGLPMYTSIRPFNVVSEDSEIIRCVRIDDIDGVRRLISKKRASPRDVDPRGVSLLWYAMYTGCSETFKLLLEEGASMDQCNIANHTCNLIDSIWDSYVDHVLGEGIMLGFNQEHISDLGQCCSMTKLALARGCVAGDSVPYNSKLPTPLFCLIAHTSRRTTTSQLTDMFKQFLQAGYDQEDRNDTGQTPLLYASFLHQPSSITLLKALLAAGANRQAVDQQGSGALHSCLLFSSGLRTTYQQICRRPGLADSDGSVRDDLEESEDDRNEAFGSQHSGHNMQAVSAFEDDEHCIGEVSERDPGAFDNEDSSSDTREVLPPDDVDDDCHSAEESDADSSVDTVYGWSYSAYDRVCYHCDGLKWSSTWGHLRGRLEDLAWYHYCERRDIDDFSISEISDAEPEPWMCRARARLKLLILLNAGCCPNRLDSDGLSPSDYAIEEGLWPQWEWALEKSGFRYDEDTDRWEQM